MLSFCSESTGWRDPHSIITQNAAGSSTITYTLFSRMRFSCHFFLFPKKRSILLSLSSDSIHISESVFALSDLENVAILLIQRTTTITLRSTMICLLPYSTADASYQSSVKCRSFILNRVSHNLQDNKRNGFTLLFCLTPSDRSHLTPNNAGTDKRCRYMHENQTIN